MRNVFFFPFLFIITFLGCEKTETFNNTDTHVGSSRVTFFPVLTVAGEKYMAVPVGGTFTDPGSSATEGGATIPTTTSGEVKTTTPGVYTLTYSATNKDGFSVSDTRTVAVYSTDASAAANDLSGTYLRPLTGVSATWTKLAPGVYLITNPGGAATGGGLRVIAFNPTAFSVVIPEQTSSDGNISSSTDFQYANGTPPTYTLVFNNPGYGPATRSFIKQ